MSKIVRSVDGKHIALDDGEFAAICPDCGGLGYTVSQSYANPPEQEFCQLCGSYGTIDWVTKMKLGMK